MTVCSADSGCVFGGGYGYSNFVLLDNNTVEDMTIRMTGGSKYGSGNAALIGTTGHYNKYGPAVFTNNKVKNLNDDSEIIDVIIENEDEIIMNSMYDRGFEKGISQGINQNKVEIARKMLNMNMSIEEISKATGLSKEEINDL